ncbi:EAL domain-containing protein [Bacillus sp. Marseille-P3661]|uniref:EAL domain-containing protein n=1 Tax=Bacillus sp. Marseille-P3661 TaxID=1936234 RepID=UPI0021553B93|nr:EAL domain-containing protein [Bacillus sp. Marseille-P3661]
MGIQLNYFMRVIKESVQLFLPNKYLRFFPPSFIVRAPRTALVRKAFQDGRQVILILFQVKNIIDLKGQYGDEYINKFKQRIKQAFKEVIHKKLPDDMLLSLFQYNSEEIALILKVNEEMYSLSDIEEYIEDIGGTVSEKFQVSAKAPKLRTGYMIVEKSQSDIEEVIQKAYQQARAVTEKRQQSQYNELLFDIRKILNQKNILLLAQPIIDVSSKNIHAYEMLTRGPKDTPFENPMHLFSVARQTNMLYELEILVLEKAFQQVIETGCKHLVFINLTPMTIGNLQLCKDITKLLYKYPLLNPKQIVLEITERESIDEIKHITTTIRLLREKGFRFAVDDTGAGYASLHTISKIMPDIIKIDRSVIQDIDSSKVKESMLKGLLLIARETGSLVVAEGIETKEEAFILSENKVDLAQGYYYAKPVEMKKAVALT